MNTLIILFANKDHRQYSQSVSPFFVFYPKKQQPTFRTHLKLWQTSSKKKGGGNLFKQNEEIHPDLHCWSPSTPFSGEVKSAGYSKNRKSVNLFAGITLPIFLCKESRSAHSWTKLKTISGNKCQSLSPSHEQHLINKSFQLNPHFLIPCHIILHLPKTKAGDNYYTHIQITTQIYMSNIQKPLT